MAKNWTISATNNTITLTRDFEKRLNRGDDEAMNLFSRLQKKNPKMDIINRPKHTRRNVSQITYADMRGYFATKEDGEVLLKAFDATREASKAFTSEYNYVRDWFYDMCPEYGNLPKFDADGKLIGYDDLPEMRKRKNPLKRNYTLKTDVARDESETQSIEADVATGNSSTEKEEDNTQPEMPEVAADELEKEVA